MKVKYVGPLSGVKVVLTDGDIIKTKKGEVFEVSEREWKVMNSTGKFKMVEKVLKKKKIKKGGK